MKQYVKALTRVLFFFKVNRFLKKIEKDESFLDCAINLSAMMEERVRQNNAVEIYTDYFQVNFSKAQPPVFWTTWQAKDELTDWEQSEAKTAMVYADPTKGISGSRRPVSAISWCPDGGSKLAIGYCSPEFQGVSETCPAQGYTFVVEDPTKHCDTLSCPSPLTSLVVSLDLCKENWLRRCTIPKTSISWPGRVTAGRWSGGTHGQVPSWTTWWSGLRASTLCSKGGNPQAVIGFGPCHTDPVYSTGEITISKDNYQILFQYQSCKLVKFTDDAIAPTPLPWYYQGLIMIVLCEDYSKPAKR